MCQIYFVVTYTLRFLWPFFNGVVCKFWGFNNHTLMVSRVVSPSFYIVRRNLILFVSCIFFYTVKQFYVYFLFNNFFIKKIFNIFNINFIHCYIMKSQVQEKIELNLEFHLDNVRRWMHLDLWFDEINYARINLLCVLGRVHANTNELLLEA